MGPWLESGAVALLAGLGAGGGYLFSRLRRPYWALGYALPMGFVLAFVLARYVPSLSFVPPFSWITAGRTEYAIFAPACMMLFVTLLPRVPQRRQRILVLIFALFMVVTSSLLPFIVPAFLLDAHSKLHTTLSRDGICLQTTDYTCGPAAAVTALKRLGIEAGEGELAVATRTSGLAGTDPGTLAIALADRYGHRGLRSEYRLFRSVRDLGEAGVVIAVVKFGFLVDHYVAVLQVTGDKVVIGDPIGGIKRGLSYGEFEEMWRRSGIVLTRADRARQ